METQSPTPQSVYRGSAPLIRDLRWSASIPEHPGSRLRRDAPEPVGGFTWARLLPTGGSGARVVLGPFEKPLKGFTATAQEIGCGAELSQARCADGAEKHRPTIARVGWARIETGRGEAAQGRAVPR